MLPPSIRPRRLAADFPPRLIFVVDTEEEFDWSEMFSRQATSVRHMARICKLQDICEAHQVRPTYVVDSSIATQADAWRPLRKLMEENRALIGAHLHAWVTPPYDEALSRPNSYQGNLPPRLEHAKLANLTSQISDSFGSRPVVFKSGRFGMGPRTLSTLGELGYKIDLSPAPAFDSSEDGGPDYSELECHPFQDEASGLLVLPWTGALLGWTPANPIALRRWAISSWRPKVRMLGILYRSKAIRRLHLTPEGYSAQQMIELTRRLFDRGHHCFVASMHSPSVMPGGTPYARTDGDVETMLATLKRYMSFFFGEFGGEPWDPLAAFDHWSRKPEWAVPAGKN